MEANNLSHVLQKWVGCINNSKCCQYFHKTQPFKRHFENTTQINKEPKIAEFSGACSKKFKLVTNSFSSLFRSFLLLVTTVRLFDPK